MKMQSIVYENLRDILNIGGWNLVVKFILLVNSDFLKSSSDIKFYLNNIKGGGLYEKYTNKSL